MRIYFLRIIPLLLSLYSLRKKSRRFPRGAHFCEGCTDRSKARGAINFPFVQWIERAGFGKFGRTFQEIFVDTERPRRGCSLIGYASRVPEYRDSWSVRNEDSVNYV